MYVSSIVIEESRVNNFQVKVCAEPKRPKHTLFD
jgi:hypothetical protein